jgi:hypothetical protein
MDPACLDGALADWSGEVAAAARYAGPCGMLSAVAQRRSKRRLSDGLEHAPTPDALRALLRRWHTAWSARALPRVGVTPDGAALSPAPRREVFGTVRHHMGQLPRVAAVVTAVGGGAVASARQGLAAPHPQRRTGRPSTPAAQPAARTKKRLAAPRPALCTARALFGQRPLHTTARKPLWRVSRGWPQ